MRIESTELLADVQEPVSLQEAKDWCNYTSDEQDNNFRIAISGCRKFLENYLQVSLIPQRITAVTTSYDEYSLFLPKPPVITVESMHQIDNFGSTPFTDYTIAGDEIIKIRPVWVGWASTGWNKYFYRVVYTAGKTTIDEDIKLALLKMIKSCWEDRGNFVKGTIVSRFFEDTLNLVAHHKRFTHF